MMERPNKNRTCYCFLSIFSLFSEKKPIKPRPFDPDYLKQQELAREQDEKNPTPKWIL